MYLKNYFASYSIVQKGCGDGIVGELRKCIKQKLQNLLPGQKTVENGVTGICFSARKEQNDITKAWLNLLFILRKGQYNGKNI